MTKSTRASLIKRNPLYRNFLAASSISLLGTSVFDLSIPMYVATKTHSVFALSAVTVALHLPFFLMAPLTGYLVDNFDKRRIMLYSDIGQVLCLCVLLAYEIFSAEMLWPLLVTVFVAKTLMIAFETVATFQLIPALIEKSDLAEANSWFMSSQRLIQILGPLLTGIVFASSGVIGCIVTNMLSFGATLYYVLKMENLSRLLGPGRSLGDWRKVTLGAIVENVQGSFQFIWRSKLFRPFVIMMFLWNLSPINPNYPTFSYYFLILKQFDPQKYSMIVSLFGVGLVGFLAAGPLYRNTAFARVFVGGGVWLASVASLSLFFYQSPVLLGGLMAISKIGGSVLSMGTFFLRQTNIPRERMGGVNSSLRMLFMSATPLTCFLQPYIVQSLGSLASFILGALCLWGVVWFAAKVAKAYVASVAEELAMERAA